MLKRLLSLARLFLISLGALLCLVTLTPLVPWTTARLTTRWSDADRDVLIVLNGSTTKYLGLPAGGIIGQNTYLRIIHTLYVWRRGHFRNIVLCGAGSAEAVKPILVAYGIPESAILVENRSISTHENALFAKPVLAGLSGRFILLTSDYHTFRASRCFAHEKIPVETIASPDILKRSNSLEARWQCFWDLADELAKIAYYRLRGWI
jgi:uncharacterized SAM-binding protein YcdF (DUF218 family)